MRRPAALFMAVAATVLVSIGEARAQNACEAYRVRPGDTLRAIASRAFGNDNYRIIYRANAARIGRDPNLIRAGVILRMPCPRGASEAAEAAVARTAAEAARATPAIPDRPLSFVTANGYLPYTDESLPGQGLFTELVETAMRRSGGDADWEVVFVDDWSAHLSYLLPRLAFDASFPWSRPDCDDDSGADEQAICDDYAFTAPFYEIVEGYFSRKGSGYEEALDVAAFRDATICRPDGQPVWHLAEQGLSPQRLLRPATAHECFERLVAGNVDIVAIDTRAGEFVSRDLGLENAVAENPHLFDIEPLRIAVHIGNPRADEIVDRLDRGLEVMLASGEWSAIVTEALRRQAEALVN